MLFMAFSAVAWAGLEAGVGTRLRGNYHLLQVVWCRYAVHLATLVLLFGWHHPQRLWRTARPAYQLGRSMMMLIMPASFVLALSAGVVPSTTWAVFWLSPLFVVVIARGLLGERTSSRTWAAVVLGVAAVEAVLRPSLPSSLGLLTLPAVMGLSFGVYVVMTRSLATEETLANLFYTAFGVFLMLTPLMPVVWVTPTAHDALVLIAIGLLGLVVLLALDRSASLVPVSFTVPVLYLQVVSVAALDLVSGHLLPRRALAGAAVIIAIVGFQWLQNPAPASGEHVLAPGS
jgi:drug/metabolite transporter (DMT)-like permease